METDVLSHAFAIEVWQVTARMPSAFGFGFGDDQSVFEVFGHVLDIHAHLRVRFGAGNARALACGSGKTPIGSEVASSPDLHARARAYPADVLSYYLVAATRSRQNAYTRSAVASVALSWFTSP